MLDFDKAGGLVPAIAQDADTGEVLMLAWMNREAFEETLRTGRAVYFSRSRNKLWRKGEESGNVQEVREVFIDCDADTILLKVNQIGGAACHEGYESCFFRQSTADGSRSSASASSIPKTGVQEMTRADPQTRHPRRQPAGGDRRAVPQGRLQDHLRQPQLLPGHRRPGDPLHAHPRPGDGRATSQDGSLDCGLTGLRLGPGERRQGRSNWPSWSSARSAAGRCAGCWRCPTTRRSRRSKDLQGKRIATEVVNITRRWLAQHGVTAQRRVQLGRRPR